MALFCELVWPTTLRLSSCCFHFTITALTVDRAALAGQKFDELTCWKGGIIYNGATLKVTELFSKAILLPMLVYGDYMAVCSMLYTCQQWVWLK